MLLNRMRGGSANIAEESRQEQCTHGMMQRELLVPGHGGQ